MKPKLRVPIRRDVYLIISILGFLVPLIVWQVVCSAHLVSSLFLPTPLQVWDAIKSWSSGTLGVDTYVSVKQVILGFVYAAVIAVPLGIYIGLFKPIEAALQPINDFFRYMPASAFIPLVLLWVGIGDSAKVSIIFIGVFFQIIVMTADVIRNVPQDYIDALYTMGARDSEVINLVVIRCAAPDILNILRVNMGWAWTYLVVAEMVAANRGLGFAIMQAQRFMDTPRIFGGIFIIGLLGVIFDLAFRTLYYIIFRWKVI